MSKIVFLGDTHFGCRGDSQHFHEFFDKFYTEVFFPYLIENNIKHVIQLGDIFDRRKYSNHYTLDEAKRYFFSKTHIFHLSYFFMHILLQNKKKIVFGLFFSINLIVGTSGTCSIILVVVSLKLSTYGYKQYTINKTINNITKINIAIYNLFIYYYKILYL